MLKKVHIVKSIIFPLILYGCESWTLKRLSTKELMVLNCGARKDSIVPWMAMRSNWSILKEINPQYLFAGLMLKWHSNTLATWYKEPTHWQRSWCWERQRAGGEGGAKGEMARWIWTNSWDRGRQGSLVCTVCGDTVSQTWPGVWTTTKVFGYT